MFRIVGLLNERNLSSWSAGWRRRIYSWDDELEMK